MVAARDLTDRLLDSFATLWSPTNLSTSVDTLLHRTIAILRSMTSLPKEHRALVAGSTKGKPEVKTKPLPTLEDDDVLVRVRGVTLNPTDWKHIDNLLEEGCSTGSDFAGEVVHADKAGKWKEGDRVAGFTRGGYIDKVSVKKEQEWP